MPALGVLHIDTMKGWRGGERQACYLAEGLHELGCRVGFACKPASETALRLQKSVVALHPTVFRFEADFSAAWHIAGLIRKYKYDILHMHDSHAHWLGGCAAIIAGRPLRIVSRRVDFSINRHGFGLSIIKYRHFADAFIAVSNAVKKALVKDGVPEGMVHVIHSGVKINRKGIGTERSELNKILGTNGTSRIVGAVGSLVGHKGHSILVEAASQVARKIPEARFVVLGEGVLRPKLESQVKRAGLSGKFFLPGHVNDASRLLGGFDVLVMPSIMEGLGTSALDAMSAGVPVIATDAGGLSEVVTNRKTGLLAESGDPGSLASAIVNMLGERTLGVGLALNAKKRVAEKFCVERMVDRTYKLYVKLLSGR